MSARILVVDDVPANVKLLEARLSAEYFDVLTATNGTEALGDLRPRRMRHHPARRHDARHRRFRGLPPAEVESGDAFHSGRHGHRARQPGRPRARARGRRRRFPDQAGVRHRADRAGAFADPAEDDDRRAAHARHHLARDRRAGAGAQRGRRYRQGRAHPSGRRSRLILRAAGAGAERRAHRRCRNQSGGSAVSRRRRQLRSADRLARPGEFRRLAAVQPGALAGADPAGADPGDCRCRQQCAAAARPRDRRQRLSAAPGRQERTAGARAHADPQAALHRPSARQCAELDRDGDHRRADRPA